MTTLTSKATALISRARLLIMQAQFAGSLVIDGHQASGDEQEIARECRGLARQIEETLPYCEAGEIAPLLECHDALHRLGYGCPPDPAFVRPLQRRVVEARAQGDRSIPESHLLAMAAPLSRSGTGEEAARMKEICAGLRDRWISALRKYSRFPDATAYETYQRLALLMQDTDAGVSRADLCRWYDANRIDDLTAVSGMILGSYRRYVMTLFPAVLDYESRQALDTAVLEELARRRDLDPRDRQAYALALDLYQL